MDRILYFDCFSGISGDMALGALIDLGLDPEDVRAALSALAVGGFRLEVTKTVCHGIAGTDINVVIDDEYAQGVHAHERNFDAIRRIIENSALSSRVKEMAVGIFRVIAEAEAAVHGKELEDVHFHEVGAVDSIVDIVGVAVCLDLLGVDRIVCSPVREGRGFVACRHGLLPVPVPAVARMLEGTDFELSIGDINGELVTPTGMGILKAVAAGSGQIPDMRIEKTGYGFGKRETGSLNALRVILGRSVGQTRHVSVMEANIDDMTGEVLGYAMERLLEHGALDVFFEPIQMKKNRPAIKLSVICANEDVDRLSVVVFAETTTLGVRIAKYERVVMERDIRTIATGYGPIRVKSASFGKIRKESPEYEDCAYAARVHGVSLLEVYRAVKEFTE